MARRGFPTIDGLFRPSDAARREGPRVGETQRGFRQRVRTEPFEIAWRGAGEPEDRGGWLTDELRSLLAARRAHWTPERFAEPDLDHTLRMWLIAGLKFSIFPLSIFMFRSWREFRRGLTVYVVAWALMLAFLMAEQVSVVLAWVVWAVGLLAWAGAIVVLPGWLLARAQARNRRLRLVIRLKEGRCAACGVELGGAVGVDAGPAACPSCGASWPAIPPCVADEPAREG